MNKLQQALRLLEPVYPLYLVLLVLFPLGVGFFVDYELFHSRDIIINLIWLPVVTLLYQVGKRKIIYKILTLSLFLIGFVEIFHWIIIRGPLTITSLLVLSNSNYQEALEFLDVRATFGLLILILYSLIYVLANKHLPTLATSKRQYVIAGIVIVLSLIFISENIYKGRFIRRATPQMVRVTHAFLNQITLYREAMKVSKEPAKIPSIETSSSKQQTFVLIIGESCSRRHMSLYNGKRETNPRLSKRDDIILYNDVVSPYSNTIESVLTMLSESNLENKMAIRECADIIDIFHSAGFKTYWISNQSPLGVWENMITSFSKKSDYLKFVNTTGNTSFETSMNVSYDEKIFNTFHSVLKEKVDKKFIILHLMGSHTSYWKRYPRHFEYFKGKGSKEETIAEYDNSILYNDFVVDSILNATNRAASIDTDIVSSAIYLSDHGENVYDDMGKVGHDFTHQLPKVNVEVPFLVWLSSSYRKKYPSKAKEIKSNFHLPFVSDDLFHAIIDLNDISGSIFRPERSVFNEKFNLNRKRILEDGKDYDDRYDHQTN